jgi:hypothetical protein
MTATTFVPSSTKPARRITRTVFGGLAAVGAVLLLLGVTLSPLMMFSSSSYSELSGTTGHLLHYAVWTACLVALSQLYPRLAGMSLVPGRKISTAAATLAAVGVALDACGRFVLAFVNPMLAEHEPSLLDTTPDAVLLVPLLGGGAIAMVGTVWLAVSGRRAGVFTRTATVMLVLGAVAIPAIGPLSNVILGAALVCIGVGAGRRQGALD